MGRSSTQKCLFVVGDLLVPEARDMSQSQGLLMAKVDVNRALIRKEGERSRKVGLVRDQFFVACMRDFQKFEFMIVVLK